MSVPGAALLRDYLDEKHLTRAEAARQIGASAAAVQYWLTGGQRPRADIRQRIEKWTGGLIPADSWLTEDEAQKLAAVHAPTGTDHG